MKAIRPKESSDSKTAARTRFRRKVNPASPPTTLELRGIRVHFPFQPYECQETYMGKTLDALLRSENALLESPTGTGKTLCLLCSTLAWQREQSRLLQHESEVAAQSSSLQPNQAGPSKAPPARVPTIIYASRTHSQLSQVVRELRNTRYRPTHAVLGSREQMCVNPKVKKKDASAHDINHDCSKLGKERKCRFRNGLEGFTPPTNESGATPGTQPVMDMEDLVAMGKSHSVCPFYYTRSKVETAELVLVPYNYLFDKDARESTLAGIPWDNAVIIFDEAHNLESFASESASFDLSNQDVAGCVLEVQRALNYMQAMPDQNSELKTDNVLKLKAIFLQLEDFILNLNSNGAFTGGYMMEIFQQGAGITHGNHEIFIEEVRKVNELMMDLRGSGSTRGSPKLEHFINCLKRVYDHGLESRCMAKATFYRVHVTPTQPGSKSPSRTVSYWCFSPALAMESLSS
jgi:regulator of telomere elongation helicase 1